MKYKTWFVLPDIHCPFHNKPLLERVIKCISENKPDGVILSGDFLDMQTLGKYNKRSLRKLKKVSLGDEYREGEALLKRINDAIPKKSKRVFLWGNHEDRFWRWLDDEDNGKVEGTIDSPTDALKLIERGWEVYDKDWRSDSYKLGSLEVCHGQFCPDNAAKKHLLEYEGSIMFGHTHRVQTWGSGKRLSVNIGCLADIWSDGMAYASRTARNKWSNAWGVVRVFEDGTFIIDVIQCFKSRFFYGNKLY